MPARRVVIFPQGGPVGPLITSSNPLPTGTQGMPYSFQFTAASGTPPYTWSMLTTSDATNWPLTSLSSSGLLTNASPAIVESVTIKIQVTDSLGLSAPQTFNFSVQGNSSAVQPPSAVWPGYVDTQSVDIGFWPPANVTNWTTGAPDHYRVYKSTTGPTGPFTLLYGTLSPWSSGTPTGVVPNPQVSGGSGVHASLWYTDRGLAPGASATYAFTAVDSAGNESVFSPAITMTTLANLPAQPPQPVSISPDTWIAPEALPAGQIWTVSATAAYNAAGTGVLNATNCGLGYALANSNPNGGDLIVVPSSAVNTLTAAGMQLQAYTGTNGWTYIITDQHPLYTGGKLLPQFSYVASQVEYTPMTLTVAPTPGASGSTSATLSPNQSGLTDASGNWLLGGGYYYVSFSDNEERLCNFARGRNTITWTAYNGFYAQIPLSNTVTTAIQVAAPNGNANIHNYVNPSHPLFAMSTVVFGTGGGNALNIPSNCNKVRIIGLNFQAVANGTLGSIVSFAQGGTNIPDSIYFDRCFFGQDITSGTASTIAHGMDVTCTHFLIHQCYFWGISNKTGGDSQAFFVRGGQYFAVQNSYLNAVSENFIFGGVAVPQNALPQDGSIRYNFTHKPLMWAPQQPQAATWFTNLKNLGEWKVGIRMECYGNLAKGCWVGATAGYHGAAFSTNTRDQTLFSASNFDQTNPSNIVSDIDIHDNLIYDCACAWQQFTADGITAVTRRLRFQNNQVWINSINPLAEVMRAVMFGPGPTTDIIFAKNTFIVNTTLPTTGVGPIQGMQIPKFGSTAGSYGNPLPYTQNQWTTLPDRVQITDNIFDSSASSGATFSFGAGLAFSQIKNLTMSNNVTISDPLAYPSSQVIASHVAYASLGMNVTPVNTAMPVHPYDWNVTSGALATASTTGGPVGAIFPNPTQPVTVQAKNWDPGWYSQISLNDTNSLTSTQRQALYQADITNGFTFLKGYCVRPHYRLIEGSFNDLVNNPATCAFVTNFLGDLSWAMTNNKKLVFKIECYSTSNNDAASIFPSYFFTTSDPNFPGTAGIPVTYSNPGSGSSVTRLCYWNTGAVNRLNTVITYLMQSLPLTVNGVNYTGLDNVPCVEGIIMDEEFFATASGQITGFTSLAGYSDVAWTNGILSAYANLCAACVKTNAIAPFNLGTYTQRGASAHTAASIAAIGQAIVNGVGAWGTPDTLPFQTNNIAGAPNNPYTGNDGALWYQGQLPASTSWAGKIPAMCEVQQPDFGNPPITEPPVLTDLYQYLNTGGSGVSSFLQVTHAFVARITSSDAADWNSSVAPFLKTHPLTNTAYPTLYPQPSSPLNQAFAFPTGFTAAQVTGNFPPGASQIYVRNLGSNGGSLSGTSIDLTAGGHSVGEMFYATQQDLSQGFTCDFTFSITAPPPSATAQPTITTLCFVLQNCTAASTGDSPGLNAGGDANIGGVGAYWYPAGYTAQYGINNSVFLKFDISSNNTKNQPWPQDGVATPNSIGLYTNVGPSVCLSPQEDLNPTGISLYSGHVMAAHVVYDGNQMVLTLTDTSTNKSMRMSWPLNLLSAMAAPLTGNNSGWIGFTGGEGPLTSGQTVNGVILLSTWTFSRGYKSRLTAPTFSVPAGQYTSSQTVVISGPPGASLYYTTNGLQPTAASSQYTGPLTVSTNTFLQAVAIQNGFTDSLIASANYQIQAAALPVINFPSGFASSAGQLVLCGVAKVSGANLLLSSGTNASGNQYPCAPGISATWYDAPVNCVAFATQFTFSVQTGVPYANTGICLVLQNQPPANDYVGTNTRIINTPTSPFSPGDSVLRWASGGVLTTANQGFGYGGSTGGGAVSPQNAGFTHGVAIGFDMQNNRTGLYLQGADPSASGTTITGMTLTSGHQFQVNVTYNGTTVSWTIKDLSNSATFSTSASANIASIVRNTTAYVGFTASSFYGIVQQITEWTWTS